MNRRKGIIAVLAAGAGSLMYGQRKVELPWCAGSSNPKDQSSCRPVSEMVVTSGTVGTFTTFPASATMTVNLVNGNHGGGLSGIDVYFGSRHVHLTPVEIMDALEGK